MTPAGRHNVASFDAQAFIELAEEMHHVGDLIQTAEHVVSTAREVLGADHASITMFHGSHRLETIAPNDAVAGQLDQLQYELREGPCYDASWHGETLIVSDLLNDSRWPQWAPKAAANGIGGMMSVELATTERRVGVLNLYFSLPRNFSPDDIGFAHIFGRHASLAVADETMRAQLRVALDSRKLIGQAQGILMERHGLNEIQAFEVLKRYSMSSNVKLRLVAEYIVATRKLPNV